MAALSAGPAAAPGRGGTDREVTDGTEEATLPLRMRGGRRPAGLPRHCAVMQHGGSGLGRGAAGAELERVGGDGEVPLLLAAAWRLFRLASRSPAQRGRSSLLLFPPVTNPRGAGGCGFPRDGHDATPFLSLHWSELLWEVCRPVSGRQPRAARVCGGCLAVERR